MVGRVNYLEGNTEYWRRGYEAENVESFVFRPYGRIFKAQFGIDGSRGEKLLDFGCGQGAALDFYHRKGFDAYGVDISDVDIKRAQERIPEIASHFAIIDPTPKADAVFFGGGYDVIVSIQTLYFLSESHMRVAVRSLYEQMNKGALIYASMMGTRSWYYRNSFPAEDGMRRVELNTERLKTKDYYITFTQDEGHLLDRFSMFRKVHVGYYDASYREDEGSDFHYTFVGQKP